MLTLTYTAEKENNIVSVSNRLMVSETQINNLLDSLVSNGYTILTTEIGDGDFSQHWNGQVITMDRYLLIELGSEGIAIETAQADFYASWLGIALVVLSVLGVRLYKRIKKGY